MASHYLNVEGTKWEYSEVDRRTGRPKRTQFPVPRLLDINDPTDWTDAPFKFEDGVINVSDGKDNDPNDIIFSGDPTPDMLPLDDAAKAISAKHIAKWNAPKEGDRGFTENLLDELTIKLQGAKSNATSPVEGFTEILGAMQKMMEQNQQMLQLLAKPAVEASTRRA